MASRMKLMKRASGNEQGNEPEQLDLHSFLLEKAFCKGLGQWIPRKKTCKCYDCGRRDLTREFDQSSDRYEGNRVCRVCVQSYKRKSGSFIAA